MQSFGWNWIAERIAMSVARGSPSMSGVEICCHEEKGEFFGRNGLIVRDCTALDPGWINTNGLCPGRANTEVHM